MKIPEKRKDKKEKVKKKLGPNKKPKPKKEQILIVAQEIKFARLLSGNEKKTRDKVLKTLKKWLLNCFEKGYEFKEDDFTRVWKGLFYAVWMSDKPLVQEELCENISGVLDIFPVEQLKHALLMFKAGLKMLATEWYGIDQHRMDKFLMLVRRYLRGSLRCLASCKWSLKSCEMYSKMLTSNDGILAVNTPHYARNATSMILHIMDCYLEEIAKVSEGDIPDESLVELLRPICVSLRGECVKGVAARRVLTSLVRQSDAGLKYMQATRAWKQMGCPEGGPEALELVSDDSDNESDSQDTEQNDSGPKPLDPRAGRVDVELSPLPVPATLIADMLRGLLTTASGKAHQRIKICLKRFQQLANSQYPLPVQCPPTDSSPPLVKSRQSVRALHQLEKNLVAASDELALRGLSRKHRKRLLAKARSGTSIVEEVQTKRKANGGWQVESSEPPPKKLKDDTNKENNNKKRKKDTKNSRNVKKIKTNKDKKIETEVVSKIDKKIDVVLNKMNENTLKSKPTQNGVNKAKVTKKDSIKPQKIKEKKITPKENGVTKDNIKTVLKKDKIINGDSKKLSGKKNSGNVLRQKKNDSKSQNPTLLVNKVKSFQKQTKKIDKAERKNLDTPKKVKFVLKNNSMQRTVDYYKSVKLSPSIPFDGTKKPSKTNLKPSTPSPINPFFKKKMKLSFG